LAQFFWDTVQKNAVKMKQAVVRGTTNPAPCCHLANDTDLLTPDVWAMAGDNKKLTRLPELTQNVIRSSHGHSKPSLKISCKSVQPLSRNVADEETQKSPENNTPSPYRGRGNEFDVYLGCANFWPTLYVQLQKARSYKIPVLT